MVSSLVTLLNC